MKVTITDKKKKDLFIALFQTLKNCSTNINVTFKTDLLYIQGMDKSHICLFEINIKDKWFDEYQVTEAKNVCFDANVFHSIISIKADQSNIVIRYEDNNQDNLNIDLITKGEFNKFFKIPLIDYDYELMNVPNVEYDAEFILSAKKICEILNQMINFGDDINIVCTEDKIDLITNGITGEMLVNIPIDDLSSYSIVEGEQINLNYSLAYINKMCLTNKLSNEVEFYISENYPMKINYDLGDDSYLMFFIAPKSSD